MKKGLYANITPKAYANMKAGFPNSKKNKKVGY